MFARTDRLLLRPGWAEDAPALFAAIADEAIIRNLANAPWPYTLDDAQAFLAAERDTLNSICLLFRRTRGAPQLIGAVGLARNLDGDVELGYWITRSCWGLGYATEAAQAVVDIARDTLRLKKLIAGHFLDNPASGRVLEKIGFRSTDTIDERYCVGRQMTLPCKLFEYDLAVAASSTMDKDTEAKPGKGLCMAA